MTVGLGEMMDELAPGRRRRVKDRAAELIAEGMTLGLSVQGSQADPGERCVSTAQADQD